MLILSNEIVEIFKKLIGTGILGHPADITLHAGFCRFQEVFNKHIVSRPLQRHFSSILRRMAITFAFKMRTCAKNIFSKLVDI